MRTKLAGFLILSLISINATLALAQAIDYDTYSEVLDAYLKNEKKKQIVILKESINHSGLYEKILNDNKLSARLDSAFNRTVNFEDEFSLKKKETVLTRKQLDALITKSTGEIGWEYFYIKYPKAIGAASLSNIYYSDATRKKGIMTISIASDAFKVKTDMIFFDLSTKEVVTKKLSLYAHQ